MATRVSVRVLVRDAARSGQDLPSAKAWPARLPHALGTEQENSTWPELALYADTTQHKVQRCLHALSWAFYALGATHQPYLPSQLVLSAVRPKNTYVAGAPSAPSG